MIHSGKTKNAPILKVKKILISQPRPENEKSPYHDLANKFGIKVDFRPFIHIEGIPAKDFRKARVNPPDYSAIILTSRNSVDHFFRICNEMRVLMPQTARYFCMTEAIALYLQKYIPYRKRKIFFGDGTSQGLMNILKKHKEEKFLFPCSDIHKDEIPEFLKNNQFRFEEAVIYRTVMSDLADLESLNYDMIVFFSPSGIRSLLHNFPDFKQGHMLMAAFGPTTARAVEEAGLRLDIKAPVPEAPSMTMAIEQYLARSGK